MSQSWKAHERVTVKYIEKRVEVRIFTRLTPLSMKLGSESQPMKLTWAFMSRWSCMKMWRTEMDSQVCRGESFNFDISIGLVTLIPQILIHDAEFQLIRHKRVIHPALCTTHNSNCKNILNVSFPGNDIIKDMLMLVTWVYSRNLVNFPPLPNGTANN